MRFRLFKLLAVISVLLGSLLLLPLMAVADGADSLFTPLNQIMARGLPHKLPRVKVDQYLPPEMAFAVPVPSKDWQRLPPDSTTVNPIQLAAFAAPQGPAQGLVEVLATELHQEVGAADWLLALMQTNGFKQIDSRRQLTASGIAFEALGSKQDPKQGEIMLRAGVWRSGTLLFTVWCSAKREAFAKLAPYYAVCLAGFKLNEPKPVKLVGQWAKHCISNVLCYTGPAEKPLERKSEKFQVVEQVFPLKQGDNLMGSLQVAVILPPESGRESPQDRLKHLLRHLTGEKTDVNLDIKQTKGSHISIRGEACYMRGTWMDRGVQHDVYGVAIQNKYFSAVVWIQSLGKKVNLQSWLHNKRVFQLASVNLTEPNIIEKRK